MRFSNTHQYVSVLKKYQNFDFFPYINRGSKFDKTFIAMMKYLKHETQLKYYKAKHSWINSVYKLQLLSKTKFGMIDDLSMFSLKIKDVNMILKKLFSVYYIFYTTISAINKIMSQLFQLFAKSAAPIFCKIVKRVFRI